MKEHITTRVCALSALALVASLVACGTGKTTETKSVPHDFGSRYAAAWSSQDPEAFAQFYAENGRLIVNDGTPSIGRTAITETAGGFMEAFPDMLVRMDSLVERDGKIRFYWRWTGTNTGPGGNGKSVDLAGYEEWTMDPDGLILVSDGHYDAEEYRRQMEE